MTDFLDNLDKLAREATPGPFFLGGQTQASERVIRSRTSTKTTDQGEAITFDEPWVLTASAWMDNMEDNAAYFAALSPAVVRSLVEVAKAARAFGHLQKELRHKTFAPDETHTPCSMRLSHINELADALTRLEEQGNSQ